MATDLIIVVLATAQACTLGLLLVTRAKIRKSMGSIATLFEMTHQTVKHLLELNETTTNAIVKVNNDTEFLRAAIQVIDQRND